VAKQGPSFCQAKLDWTRLAMQEDVTEFRMVGMNGLDILPSIWRVDSYIAGRPVQYQIHNDFFNQLIFFDIFLEESSKLDQLKEQQPRGKRKTTLEYISLPTFEECRRWLRKNVDMMTKLVCQI